MKFLVQRVKNASVEVDKKIVGSINRGFMVLIGINHKDTEKEADNLVKRLIKLRIFDDENGKMNLSLNQVGGSLLLVSQFTLYANTSDGNRPSFTDAAKPEYANKLYEYIIQKCKETGIKVETGIFGADMKVSLINDGPVTIMLEK